MRKIFNARTFMVLAIAVSFASEICLINFAPLLLGAFALNSNRIAPARALMEML